MSEKKPLEKSPIEKQRDADQKSLAARKDLALTNLDELQKGLQKYKHYKDAGIHSVHVSMLKEMFENKAKNKLYLSEGNIDTINMIHEKLKDGKKI